MLRVIAWIVPRVCVELTYTAWDLQPFAQDCGYHGPPFRWEPERRFLLRCELDAAFFRLYGVAREDVDYIMDTFPIVRRNDEKAHGEYRTKRVILEIYDEMAAATAAGITVPDAPGPPAGGPARRAWGPDRNDKRRRRFAWVNWKPRASLSARSQSAFGTAAWSCRRSNGRLSGSRPQVRDLLDSLYRGFPVGTLLFWRAGDLEYSRDIESDAAQGSNQRNPDFVLDGPAAPDRAVQSHSRR